MTLAEEMLMEKQEGRRWRLPFRLARPCADSAHVVVAQGAGGRWRWRVVSRGSTLALSSVGRGFLSKAGAVADWLSAAKAMGADSRMPIEIDGETYTARGNS